MQSQEIQFKSPFLDKPVRITEQVWPEGALPVVSVFCITYNHLNFIRDAIEGFLMQETTFPVEIFIHDDASKDGTAEIVQEYAEKYPKLFWIVLQTENQFLKGNKKILDDYLQKQRGEFIALCEGDDYWTDSAKLQKQVTFLKSYKNSSFSFHKTLIIDDKNNISGQISPSNPTHVHSIVELLSDNFIHTSSILYRKAMLPAFPDWFDKCPMGDWPLCILLAERGQFLYIDEVMSHYRLHGQSSWSSQTHAIRRAKSTHLFDLLKDHFAKKPELLAKVNNGFIMHCLTAAKEFKNLKDAENANFFHEKVIEALTGYKISERVQERYQGQTQHKSEIESKQAPKDDLFVAARMDEPMVSICLPTYNGEEYLAEALRSAIAQTYPHIEILLSDDGSTDRTTQIAEEILKDSPFPVRILKHAQLGLVGNWNYCISEAKGKYIKFLFQDDLLHPDCVSELVKVAESDAEVGLVFSPRNVVQDNNSKPDIFHSGIIVLHKSWTNLKTIQSGKSLLEDARLFIEPLNKIGEPTTVLIRREVFEMLGGFDENLRQLVDVEMWIRIMTKFKIGFVDKLLSTFRVHQKQATKTNFKEGLILADFKKFFTKLNISSIYSNLPANNKRNAAFMLQRLGGPIPLNNLGVPKIFDQQHHMFQGAGGSQSVEESSSMSPIDKKPLRPPSVIPLSDLNKRPFWSIMIPTYNPKPEYLNKVLRSVLAALPKGVDAQIEILDDASPDCDVAALLKKMSGMGKVSIHRNAKNLGYIANWNACIERARGEWLHILHQDDFVLAGFYEKISAGVKLHPEAGAAFCRHKHINAQDETKFTSALERAEPGILDNWLERLSSMQKMQFVSTVVRRSTFEKVGGFWSEARSAADWEMWMRIAAAAPVFFHSEILACFRIHNISESSRLLMSGENSTDTCKAIDLFSQYLPEDKRAQLVAVAKNHYARSSFGLALSFLQQKQFAAASAQVNAALELEPTHQNEQIAKEIRVQIPATVLNESTLGAANSQQTNNLLDYFNQKEVDNFQHLLTAFQAAPGDAYAQKPLRDLRKRLADYLLGVQPSDLQSLMSGSFGKVFDLIVNSGLRDEEFISEESAFAESLVGGFDAEGQFDIRRLIASMLFWRAHRMAAMLSVELIPSWLFENYINYLIFSPEAFQEIGESEAYRTHIHHVLAEFWRRIEESPCSSLSLKLSRVVASRLNLIPLYFNEQGNKETYILRAKFLGHFLESRGLKLAETGQKTSSFQKRIKVGFLNAHFTSQTETYTTIPTFSHLDRRKFEVVLYCLVASGGPLENFCRKCADAFVVLPQSLEEQIKKIRGDNMDALVIGTNVTAVTNQAALLASARLAPVQLINNSSPVTSGMPHVDGYLSGSFLVDEKSGEDYSEKLCLLDGPSHCFNYEVDRRAPVVKLDRVGLGIPQDAVVYFSGANCFKIIPEMQEAWARILAKVPGSMLLLHPFNPNWASQYPVRRFERNMLAAFARHGVKANRLILSRERLPSRSDVLELIKLSDIYLDSFPFAGVNSAVDPLEVGIPLVACEMQTFRSRMAGSLLRELKIEELIASGEKDYIDLAVKLGLDSAYRTEVSQKIVFAMGQNPRFLDSAAYSENMGRIIESLVGRSSSELIPTIEDFAIQDARAAYAEGRLREANEICRYVLVRNDKNAAAWNLMAQIAASKGDASAAEDFAAIASDLDAEVSLLS
jgi:predicted O-linked N-acetylglucosamine transferase (SPINDLY family)/glycosyltransferase involved in cell wall biosynthesis